MGLFDHKKSHSGLDDEALNYFRANNDEYMGAGKWAIIIPVGIVSAMVLGFLYGYVMYFLSITSTWLTIGFGFLIATVLKKVAGNGSLRLGVFAVICFILFALFSYVAMDAIYLHELIGTSVLKWMLDFNVWRNALESLFSLDGAINTIIYAIGGFAAFRYASN